MAYTKYTDKLLRELLHLERKKAEIFPHDTIVQQNPGKWLSETLQIAKKLNITTEKAVCETLISPILTELKLQNEQFIDLYSGEQLNVDKSKNLNGEIDFLFAKISNSLEIKSPILCITEAKIGFIDKGIPQAAAQMFAARLFNEQEGKPTPIMFGAVTDGKTWRFLKLEGQTLFTDIEVLYLDNLPLLLGVLQKCVSFYR